MLKKILEDILETWSDESAEAAKLVIKSYGAPIELTDSMLIWHDKGQWKRIIAYKDFDQHNFPAPHIDSVECFIDYAVPPEKFTELALFDGSVIVQRTRGELSARCHDVEANYLALNLANDIVTNKKSVTEAREYYAKEFLDYRLKKPTPYMNRLQFDSPHNTKDKDISLLSPTEIEVASEQGRQRE